MKHTVEVMISEADVAARIAKLGEEITARYQGSDEVVMIGLLRGSCVFLADLCRQTPLPIEGSGYTLEADLVVKALGFDPEEIPTLFGAPELKVSRWGTVQVKYATMMTNLDGVFAAGDIVRGASLVVWGIKDGRDAAEGIHKFIQAKAAQPVAVAAE